MNAKELKELSSVDLQAELQKNLQQGFNLRVMRGTMQQVKPHLFKQARRTVARIKTILAQNKAEEGK